uniref:Sulfotransferase domain-containing protein n=1 Tax=Mucochytrium quahogii TaxID=96639 RepID=A0A7S2RQN1_9STRA|mmetsp:Transcript_15254/g.24773  ORF Transcript_15254/g.24773 Transcript_15254/m.24773 type:complete len:523 (-) Transcript_15254:227-1795(-)
MGMNGDATSEFFPRSPSRHGVYGLFRGRMLNTMLTFMCALIGVRCLLAGFSRRGPRTTTVNTHHNIFVGFAHRKPQHGSSVNKIDLKRGLVPHQEATYLDERDLRRDLGKPQDATYLDAPVPEPGQQGDKQVFEIEKAVAMAKDEPEVVDKSPKVQTKRHIPDTPTFVDPTIGDSRLEKYKYGFPKKTFLEEFKREQKGVPSEREGIHIIQRDIGLLVKEAKMQLNTSDCVPTVCDSSMHLFGEAVPKVMLVSRPGSGNTWIRSLIQSGMRTYTGAIYHDYSLARGGYKGELIPYMSKRIGVVKSHYPTLSAGGRGDKWAQGVIHVVRAPFDAYTADYQRLKSRDHTATLEKEKLITGCTRTALRSRRWGSSLELWESRGTNVGPLFANFTDFVRVHYVNNMPAFTFVYEDLVNNLEESLLHLFAVLKYFYRNRMPSVYEATTCALRDIKIGEKFHRKANTPVVFANNKTLSNTLCERYSEFWNTHKWGKCDGTLQKHRTDNVRTPPSPLPKSVCDSPSSSS